MDIVAGVGEGSPRRDLGRGSDVARASWRCNQVYWNDCITMSWWFASMIRVFLCEELARGSPWTTRSGDELGLGLKLALVGTGCTEVLSRKFVQVNGGGSQEAQSDAIGSPL